MLRNQILGLVLAATAFAQGGPPATGTGALIALTAEASQQLAFMREEEKLARDLYRHLFEKWNVAIFDRISKSEQNHFDAVGRMLVRYNVADPAANLPAGVYANATLQALYQQLVAKGDVSVRDALEVGVLVEKQDIADLEAANKGTANAEIKRVYNNLMLASYNHLEAFEECWQVSGQ